MRSCGRGAGKSVSRLVGGAGASGEVGGGVGLVLAESLSVVTVNLLPCLLYMA